MAKMLKIHHHRLMITFHQNRGRDHRRQTGRRVAIPRVPILPQKLSMKMAREKFRTTLAYLTSSCPGKTKLNNKAPLKIKAFQKLFHGKTRLNEWISSRTPRLMMFKRYWSTLHGIAVGQLARVLPRARWFQLKNSLITSRSILKS